MVRLIGVRRILGILALAALLVLLFFYSNFLMKPGIQLSQQQLMKNKAEVSEMSNDIDKLTQGIELFTTQKDEFLSIKELGFFDPQDRVEARRRLNAMQEESRLLSAKYTIKQARSAKNEKAAAAGYKVLDTEIDFEFEALEDTDIYNFIYLLNYGFPGMVQIDALSLVRDVEITQPLLRNIGNGDYEALVTGSMRVSWITMVPDSSLSVQEEADE